jgi:hypothetical protein
MAADKPYTPPQPSPWSSPDDKHDEQKIVCHAPGDRCHGCDHYKGKAPVCSFAPSAGGEPAAYIEHHKGGDNLVWEQTAIPCTPLYKQTVSATGDTARLNWLERVNPIVFHKDYRDGAWQLVVDAHLDPDGIGKDFEGKTLREAVDAAMAQPADSRGDSDA